MSGRDDANDTHPVKHLALALVEAYVDKDRVAVATTANQVTEADDVAEVTSELKVYASFLTRRVQETGVVWKPADSREAVARAVADLLPPEIELAVVTAWEAYSVGENEAAEHFSRGDPLVFMHMLAAFTAAIGLAIYSRSELVSTLRIASGLSE